MAIPRHIQKILFTVGKEQPMKPLKEKVSITLSSDILAEIRRLAEEKVFGKQKSLLYGVAVPGFVTRSVSIMFCDF